MAQIQAVKYDWGNYSCYLGIIGYCDVPKFIKSEIDQSMNRDIDPVRVQEIITYISQNSSSSFFPPVILNSYSKIDYDPSNQMLKVTSRDFTIIDGQHRVRAITEIFNKADYSDLKKNILDLSIPFLLIESLEPELHRNLFKTINDNAANVESTVSERFTPILRNLIGLKYISQNPQIKPLIEWEEKQSIDRIVYKHLTRCNDELINCLKKVLSNKIDVNNQLIYKNEHYYKIFECLWNTIFTHINNGHDYKSFWVRFITIFSLCKILCETIESDDTLNDSELSLEDISDKIVIIIKKFGSEYLLEYLVFNYSGKFRQNESTYNAIRDFIKTNKKLIDDGIDPVILNSSPKLQVLVNRYVLLNHLKGEYFVFDDYETLKQILSNIIEHKTQLEAKEEKFFISLKEINNIEDLLV